ncbi:hypothetical protein KC19_1G039100 [Ceratodon purpureus]|uniref:Uncharacterized protein n=1 Tax=Ceratodon purpureus TaxID=3225 RepID=A0A8T0J2A5_CERPU|nr:hypothetical protein KC19_1G039100 [Ceratodon purpureus]
MASKASGSSNEREGAEILKGAEALPKFVTLLQGFGFPGGLFSLPSVEEFGFVEKTGFFWLKQPGRLEHTFPMAKVLVVYHAEVSGRIQKGKMTTVKGLKLKYLENKDLFLAASASEVWLDDPPSGKIHFRTSGGKHPTEESFSVEVFAAGQ